MIGWHTAAIQSPRDPSARPGCGETVPDVVAVTGGDGFIGSHLVERLVAEGCRVSALALNSAVGTWGRLDQLAAAKWRR